MTAEDWMGRAVELARESAERGTGGPFGAIVVCQGELLAEGANLVTATSDPTAHAEIVAIREACRRLGQFQLAGCEIYSSCGPCPMCLGAIYWARPACVYFAATRHDAARFGFDDSFIYDQIPLAPGERAIAMKLLAPPHTLAPFEAWQRSIDKVPY